MIDAVEAKGSVVTVRVGRAMLSAMVSLVQRSISLLRTSWALFNAVTAKQTKRQNNGRDFFF
jgi:hypothetical protein